MIDIIQGGHTGILRQAVDIERLPHPFQGVDYFRAADAISQAQGGQTVYLGKGPQNYGLRPLAQHCLSAFIVWMVHILAVSLINYQQHIPGKLSDKLAQGLPGYNRPGRIIGVAYEYQLGARADLFQHGRQIMGIIAQRNLDAISPHNCTHQFILGKCGIGQYDLIAGIYKSLCQHFQNLIGTVANCDTFRAYI